MVAEELYTLAVAEQELRYLVAIHEWTFLFRLALVRALGVNNYNRVTLGIENACQLLLFLN